MITREPVVKAIVFDREAPPRPQPCQAAPEKRGRWPRWQVVCVLVWLACLPIALGVLDDVLLDPDAAERRALAREATYLRLAIEDYGLAHVGEYPAPADWTAALGRQPGPHGGKLPVNPWSPTGARLPVVPAGTHPALPTAAALADGAPAPRVGLDLGPGRLPGAGKADATTYGAVIYDYEPRSGSSVLYVVGKRGDRAVVLYVSQSGGC